jgi:hypothetical protein
MFAASTEYNTISPDAAEAFWAPREKQTHVAHNPTRAVFNISSCSYNAAEKVVDVRLASAG